MFASIGNLEQAGQGQEVLMPESLGWAPLMQNHSGFMGKLQGSPEREGGREVHLGKDVLAALEIVCGRDEGAFDCGGGEVNRAWGRAHHLGQVLACSTAQHHTGLPVTQEPDWLWEGQGH